MFLHSLSLTNFKNIEHANLHFSPKLNCFLGDNGMGKSNLLDAIYFLSFCKSFTGVADPMLILKSSSRAAEPTVPSPAAEPTVVDASPVHMPHPFAMLQAQYLRRGADEALTAAIQAGRRKSLKRGGKEYKKLSEHIGKFPLVLVSPSDMELVNGTGEERRRFMDMVISQTDSRYLDALIRYGRALEQRNRMLRDAISDPNLYLAVEMAMEGAAAYICATRRQWTAQLSEIFVKYYSAIAGDGERPELRYQSHLADPATRLSDLFEQRRARDAALGYTSAGPHRDDIEMSLAGLPVRRTASQGQAKTYTIALRFAQYEFLKQATGMSPLLLLDDIFDKLDAHRVERIMAVVSGDTFGQIFITDTNRKHLDEILARSGGDFALFTVKNGIFSS